jgi:hypothetical protein
VGFDPDSHAQSAMQPKSGVQQISIDGTPRIEVDLKVLSLPTIEVTGGGGGGATLEPQTGTQEDAEGCVAPY